MKKYSLYFLALGAVFLVLVARIFYQSRHAYSLGMESQKNGRFQEAIMQYDQSAHWYFPGNPYVSKSLQQLWVLGESLEQSQPKLSLWAFDSMRGSIYAVRSFYIPNAVWLEKVNEKIATLRAAEEVATTPTKTLKEATIFHRQKLAVDRAPNLFWSVALEVSFFAWIICVLGLIWKGFDSRGVMHARSSVSWVFGIILWFGVWIISLLRA